MTGDDLARISSSDSLHYCEPDVECGAHASSGNHVTGIDNAVVPDLLAIAC